MNTETNTNQTFMELRKNERVVYEKKEILGGIISWYVRKYADQMGNELIIVTSEEPQKIFINGKEYLEKL